MDERDDLYLMDEELEDGGRYYDDADELTSPPRRLKRVLYPPRLMVDFKSLGVEALKRYAKFYHIKVGDASVKEELAAQVARHFDMSLEVEEDDSIVAFMQRLRNGERTAVKRSTARDKERKAAAAADKAKRKSNSRKRHATTRYKKTKKDADTGEDNELYCICNLPSYGNMIACDGKTCPNPSQWYHLDHKKKKNKTRSKSPGNK
ncbi:hypothetical protein PRIC2_009583 [Phytophthora ramorum]